MPEEMKKCSGPCDQYRPAGMFHRSANAADGRQGYCIVCRRAYDKSYYVTHERFRRAQMAAWERQHPGAANERLRKRREILKAAPGGLSQTQRDEYVAGVGECMGCGALDTLSFDHVVPLSRGGADTLDNAAVVCGRCNRMKRSKIVDVRRRWQAQRDKAAARMAGVKMV